MGKPTLRARWVYRFYDIFELVLPYLKKCSGDLQVSISDLSFGVQKLVFATQSIWIALQKKT